MAEQIRPTMEIINTGRKFGEFEMVGGWVYTRPLRRILLKNGVQLSVQASSTHYCSPRNDVGPWVEVEVGVFNKRSPIRSFGRVERQGKWRDPSGWWLYAYVPLNVVEAYIQKAGGIVGDIEWSKPEPEEEIVE